MGTHREIFSKSYRLKLKSDYIYHFPIDLEQQPDVRLVPNQSEYGKYNLISVRFNKISLDVQSRDTSRRNACGTLQFFRRHGSTPTDQMSLLTNRRRSVTSRIGLPIGKQTHWISRRRFGASRNRGPGFTGSFFTTVFTQTDPKLDRLSRLKSKQTELRAAASEIF